MIGIFDFVKNEQLEELTAAIKVAFNEIREENKLHQEKNQLEFKELKDSNINEEYDQKIINIQRQIGETKQVLLQLSALIERLYKEKTEKIPAVSMERYQEVQTETVPESEIKQSTAPGIPPDYVTGYFEDGTPKLNINEIPMGVNPEKEIIIESHLFDKSKEDASKARKKYVELYPMINEDAARCVACKKYIKIEEPQVGKTRNGQKMTEGRCPLCKAYVVRII